VSELFAVSDEVRDALERGAPVVALETTLVAHGFPAPVGVEVGVESDRAVRDAGATPATIGVLDGHIGVGLEPRDLERFTPAARKLGPRDLAACAVRGEVGATTVGGTLAVARTLGIRFLGTGGTGGVHRGFPSPPDVSADIPAIARTAALVVSSGVKSLLDVPATTELLETLGVPVVGYRTSTLPLFYSAEGGPALADVVETPAEAARMAAAHWELGGAGILLANPPPESVEVEGLIADAVAEAAQDGITGQAVTPYVLGRLHERSDGRTRDVNRALIVANARLAAEVAVAYAAL
jgi:pseudouridylate synthase